MTIDAYQHCFCGSGKKVKFCCSKDIMHELDGILESLTGDQRIAALDKINRLVSRVGRRDCLSVIKVTILMQVGEIEEARRELNEFLVGNPMNSIARAQDAILEAYEGHVDQAVQRLQDAMDVTDTSLTNHVVEAFGSIGSILLQVGRVRAARHHLMVYDQLKQSEEPRIRQLILSTYTGPYVPLLLKSDMRLLDCPADVEWVADFEAANQLSRQGRWRAAIRKLEDIDEQFPNQMCVVKNIAILYDYLGEPEDCCDAWRNYSQLEEIALLDAVEAEATAQLIDPVPPRCVYQVVRRTFPVKDLEALLTRLGTDPHIAKFEVQAEEFVDGPPPKGGYYQLNMPLPESGVGISADQVPEIDSQFLVFGKQTDREARLEWYVTLDENADGHEGSLKRLIGDLLGEQESDDELDTVPMSLHVLEWRCRWPLDTSVDTRKEVTKQKRREILLKQWPDCPLDVLDGKTPAEAAQDPQYKIRLLAALLLLEDSTDIRFDDTHCVNDLRENLGLERYEMLRPTKDQLASMTISQLAHLDFSSLEDPELVDALKVASSMNVPRAILGASREIANREQLDEVIGMQYVYHGLARFEPDDAKAIEYAVKSRNTAVNKGESAGVWLVHELEIRLERGLTERCDEIVRTLEARYMNDQAVANDLVRVLTRFGVISQDGGGPGIPPEAEAPAAASAAAGGVWSPEGGEESAAPQEGKSKLWLPGMD